VVEENAGNTSALDVTPPEAGTLSVALEIPVELRLTTATVDEVVLED